MFFSLFSYIVIVAAFIFRISVVSHLQTSTRPRGNAANFHDGQTDERVILGNTYNGSARSPAPQSRWSQADTDAKRSLNQSTN